MGLYECTYFLMPLWLWSVLSEAQQSAKQYFRVSINIFIVMHTYLYVYLCVSVSVCLFICECCTWKIKNCWLTAVALNAINQRNICMWVSTYLLSQLFWSNCKCGCSLALWLDEDHIERGHSMMMMFLRCQLLNKEKKTIILCVRMCISIYNCMYVQQL